jgi:hypothetical protein
MKPMFLGLCQPCTAQLHKQHSCTSTAHTHATHKHGLNGLMGNMMMMMMVSNLFTAHSIFYYKKIINK